ncbi:MAG: nitrilase-related carbon-nitrogen hydrolase [Planctomycetota bacterium]|nr:nitrilase-related carbon-nitrogen hydrolase [Planctomycetota bacterium]
MQLDIAWEQPRENFAHVERLLDGAEVGAGDLVLLPEMFATGFSLHTETTADRDGATLAFLQRLAERLGCWVQGGRTVVEAGRTKADNRMSIVSPTGVLTSEYTKVHPFSFGREPERFAGGTRVETWVWDTAGDSTNPAADPAMVCPAICYDLRFPELFRIGAVRGAEVFALGACWPAARQAHWRALTIARAIENQGVVLAVNRTGDDPHLHYAGGSIAVDATGTVLGELGPEPGVLSVAVDVGAVRQWRETFPALQDVKLREIR